jgi:hypothetical protein
MQSNAAADRLHAGLVEAARHGDLVAMDALLRAARPQIRRHAERRCPAHAERGQGHVAPKRSEPARRLPATPLAHASDRSGRPPVSRQPDPDPDVYPA